MLINFIRRPGFAAEVEIYRHPTPELGIESRPGDVWAILRHAPIAFDCPARSGQDGSHVKLRHVAGHVKLRHAAGQRKASNFAEASAFVRATVDGSMDRSNFVLLRIASYS